MPKEYFVQEDQTHDVMSNDQLNHEHFNQSKSQELSSNCQYFESSCAPPDEMACHLSHDTSPVGNLTNDKPCAETLVTMTDHMAKKQRYIN